MQKNNFQLILIDGSSYLYRAFHALPSLANSQGEPTGAIYGMLSMIKKLLAKYDAKYVAVVFDAKGKSFRHELYPLYKAHRPTMPIELQIQIKYLHELIAAMGLPMLVIDGVEADDVIATLATKAKQSSLRTLIASGDKDLQQLVDDNTIIIDTMNDVLYDATQVEKKFGVKPSQILDYLTLVGDSSDNVPGVPKIGPKTAVKLLQQYVDIENIVQNANNISGAIGENIRNSLEQLPLSRHLLTLKTDVDFGFTIKDLEPKEKNKGQLLELFKHLEFKKWLAEMIGSEPKATLNRNYQTILTEAAFDDWLDKLNSANCFAFDTETTGLDPFLADLVGISFSIEENEAVYIPLSHNYQDAPQQLSRDLVLEKLKNIFADPSIVKLGHNLKYDLEVLSNYNIEVQGIGYDTMLESYVLNSTNNRHNMDSMALQYLQLQTITFEEVAGKGKNMVTFDKVPLSIATEYAAEDADVVLKLHHFLWPKIAAVESLENLFKTIERPLVKVLAKVEQNGVCIDVALLNQHSKELAARINELENQAYKLAEAVFNLSSPKQLQEILFTKMKLPVIKQTPGGQPSTAEEVLQELALDYPLPKIILEHRSLSKLKSTYTDSLPKQINPKTNRIHTTYHQAVTSTGRLSSSDPNLQNIPIRSAEGKKIRQAFIAPENKKIVAADYSQIELRIMAHLSHDGSLLKAFADGLDVHQATAAEVFAVTLADVTEEQRRKAKAINFGLIYGMSAFGLARQLNIPRDLAQAYINVYFERYPAVANYMQETKIKAKQQGFVETLFGRRLFVPDINASNMQRRNAAERAAINAPLQGTAADIIKIAMINIDKWISECDLDVKMIMQVHDELVFEIADQDVENAVAKIRELMVNAASLLVPLEVDIAVGNHWD